MKEKKGVWTPGNIFKLVGFLILGAALAWFTLTVLYPIFLSGI